MEGLLFFGFVVLAGAIAYFAWKARQAEIERLTLWAQQHGLSYRPDKFTGFGGGIFDSAESSLAWTEQFQPFGVGHARYGQDLFVGRLEGMPFSAFNYNYTTGSGKNQTHHSYGIAYFDLPVWLGGLDVSREGFLSGFAGAIGFADIQFESEEFNKMFCIRGPDERHVYDFFHPQMMEYFQFRGFPGHLQIKGNRLVYHRSGSYAPEDFLSIAQFTSGMVALIPNYMRQAGN